MYQTSVHDSSVCADSFLTANGTGFSVSFFSIFAPVKRGQTNRKPLK